MVRYARRPSVHGGQAKYVLVTEDDQGFVRLSLIEDEELADKIRAERTRQVMSEGE